MITTEETRKLLKSFLEFYEATIDYLPCEKGDLIDSFMEDQSPDKLKIPLDVEL